MSFDEDTKRKALESRERSAVYEGKSHVEKLKKEIVEGKKQKELSDLKRDILKTGIQKQEQKSRPTKNRKKEVVEAKEKAEDAKAFVEKRQERQKALDQALQQEPEHESEEVG